MIYTNYYDSLIQYMGVKMMKCCLYPVRLLRVAIVYFLFFEW